MYGPEAPGHWTAHQGPNCAAEYGMLKSGRRYRVVKAFVDFDGDLHAVGEQWDFLGSAFLPYDDGLSLFVSLDGTNQWHIPMQCRPETQGEVVARLDDYLVATS